jgi:AmiR/NasT family two-component response regulator
MIELPYFSSLVHQAEGVLSIRIGVSIKEAAVVMREFAAIDGIDLEDIADQIVHHGLTPARPG